MKRLIISAVFAVLWVLAGTHAFAQARIEAQPFGGKLKLEGYGEYINFNGDDINADSWGGGIMARYLFTDWLGIQTSFALYSDANTNKLGGDLNFSILRVSLIFHTYINGMDGPMPLYVYGGGGVGGQFNSEVAHRDIDNAVIGQVLGGIGYDFPENFFIEVEGGYQFGNAGISDYTNSNIGVEAVFIRAGVGIKL